MRKQKNRRRNAWLLISLLTVTALHVACESPGPVQDLSRREANKALIMRTWEEMINQGKLDLADDLFSEDYVYYSSSGESFRGIESGVIEPITAMREAFPDLRCTVLDMIAQGDRVAHRWSATGTHRADFMGVARTDSVIEMTGIVISRIENGKVVEDWSVGDDIGLLQQLGVFPNLGRLEYSWGRSMERGTGTECDSSVVEALYRREIQDVWSLGDINALDEILSPSLVNHDPAWPDIADFESFKKWGDGWIDQAPDMRVTIDDMVVDGNMLAARWTATWTDEKGIAGFSPTGGEMTIHGIDIVRCVEGRIVERWWTKDILGVMRQLGIAPPFMGGDSEDSPFGP